MGLGPVEAGCHVGRAEGEVHEIAEQDAEVACQAEMAQSECKIHGEKAGVADLTAQLDRYQAWGVCKQEEVGWVTERLETRLSSGTVQTTR